MKVVTNPLGQLDRSTVSTLYKEQPKEVLGILLFLIFVVGLKLGLTLYLWRTGYIEYDADGFTRSVRAWQWHAGQTKLEVDAWLPLQFWLNGWLMNFWPDLLRLPRVVNTVCSILTTLNFFFIGRSLFGRLNGYATALLAALFPWEIWFSISGMSESLTHVFLSVAVVFVCRWLKTNFLQPFWLLLASLGFLGASMVRYEAWFYSSAYALLVFWVLWRQRSQFNTRLKVQSILAILPAFGFILVWMLASWMDPRLNSPLGFAKLTSEINATIYGAANQEASLFNRIFHYPHIFVNLLLPLSTLAIAGSGLVVWRPKTRQIYYVALVWGEFVLFILTTLPYNNIAPGSGRYPVSNLLLLLPVAVYSLQFLFQSKLLTGLALPAIRWLAAGFYLILLLLMVNTTLTRSKDFPDGYTRQVARWLENNWNTGYLQPSEKVLLHLPPVDGPDAGEFTRAYYALKVLTNHADNFVVEADYTNFSNAVSSRNGDVPHVWVHMEKAGGSTRPFEASYRQIEQIGDYTIGSYPFLRGAFVTPTQGKPGQTFQFKADEYKPSETTTMWITRPDGATVNLGNQDANQQGLIFVSYNVKDVMPGTWFITIVGMETGRRSTARFELTGS